MAGPTALVSDAFVRADGALSSAGWAQAGFATSPMQNISGSVFGDLEPSGSLFTGTTFPADQWAQCLLGTMDGTTTDVGIGVVLRGATGSGNGYVALANNNQQVFVGKYVGGGFTHLATIATGVGLAGSTLRMEVEGTTIRVYRNGTQIDSGITDSSLSSGYPGLVRKDSATNFVQDFHAGDFLGPTILGVDQVDASAAGSGSTSLTVPAATEAVLAFWMHFDGNGGTTLGTLTLAGTSLLPAQVEQPEGVPTDETGGGVAAKVFSTTGSQTLAWAWSAGGARSEGGGIFIVYLDDVNTSSLVRAAAYDAQVEGDPPSVSYSALSTDKCVTLYQSFSAGSTIHDPVKTWINNTAVNSENYRLVETGSDNTGTTAGVPSPLGQDYSSIGSISVKRTAGAPVATAATSQLARHGIGMGRW